jgi:diguanylate cyclase (GGDEF)-like protein
VLLAPQSMNLGSRALVALPLVVGGEAVGVLTLHAREPGFFDDEEMKLLLELAGDVSFAIEHIEKSEKADYLAYYDVLTGLANRTLFIDRLTHKLNAAAAGQHKVAVLLVDVERFKSVNDSLGRHAGDQLLKQIAERLRNYAPDTVEIARAGSDQFKLAIPGVTDENDVARFIEQGARECFGAPFQAGGADLRVRVKVGIAMYPNDGADAETLSRNSEAALERAKSTGSAYVFFADDMSKRVAGKLALEQQLEQALEKDEFVLHYQPKVDLESRRIVGMEALIRWMNAERGLVPPGQFIPLLEETGLIREVGVWAIRRAVRDHRHWLRQGLRAPRVAVNVSQIQLRQQDFVEVLREAIAQGANPTGIDLEITESMVMHDVAANIAKLKAVRDLGVSIAIDDFGTGYSSLGYLAKLPVQALKIDRSFIVAMASDPDAMTLTSTIISLAHSLRLQVIAEGVETEEQARMLRLLRCDQMQGYLFSRPLPFEEITGRLEQRAPG